MSQISKQSHYPSDVLLYKASFRINKESVKLLYHWSCSFQSISTALRQYQYQWALVTACEELCFTKRCHSQNVWLFKAVHSSCSHQTALHKIPSKYRVIIIREDLRLIRRKTGSKEPPKTDAFLVCQWKVLIWPP